MKKILSAVSIAAMLFGATNAMAAPTKNEKKAEAPEIFISVYDTTTNPFTDLKTTKISRSNPNRQLCWVTQGDFTKEVNFIETMKAPAKQIVPVDDGRVSTSDNGKTNTIRGTLNSFQNGNIFVKCWRFEESDPIGKYTLQVQIGKKVFKPLAFSVVK